jgi:hypothetical protein
MVPCCSAAQLCAAGFNIEPPPGICALLSGDVAPEPFAHAVPDSLNLVLVDNSGIHTTPRLMSFRPSQSKEHAEVPRPVGQVARTRSPPCSA